MPGANPRLNEEPNDVRTRITERPSQFVTRRRVLTAGTFGVATLAGCSGSGSPSQPDTATPPSEAQSEFELREITSDQLVQQGGTLTAAVTIANVGSAEGTASVSFSLAAQSRVEEISLQAGEAKPVTVEFEVTQIEPARYELVAEGPNRELSTFVDVFPAELDPGLHGAILSGADASLAGNSIDVTAKKGNNYDHGRGTPDSDGRFKISHPSDPPYEAVAVAFKKQSLGVHNGLPAVFDLEDGYRVEESSVLLGQYEIPEAYRTEIQMVNTNGNPLADFSAVNFRTQSGVGLGPSSFTTNVEGYVQAEGSAESGISLPMEGEGALTIELQPDGQSRPVRLGSVYGSEAGEEFTFEVENPDQY